MTDEAEKLRWIAALTAFDYCEPALLADMVQSELIPKEIRSVISSVVSGERKGNRRAAAKAKVPTSERIMIGATIDALLTTFADMKHPAITEPYAERKGFEPSDAVAYFNKCIEHAYEIGMQNLNVSRETVENLVRDYRNKVQNWPNV